jgi:hypothetical protein
MVSTIVPPGLLEPRKILGNNNLIFGELICLGAQIAIGGWRIPPIAALFKPIFPEIYNDRRNTAIKELVKDRAQQLNDASTQSVATSVNRDGMGVNLTASGHCSFTIFLPYWMR